VATHKYWENEPAAKVDYTQIDPAMLKLFTGTHPAVVRDWLSTLRSAATEDGPKAEGIFRADADYQLSPREKKHRLMLKLERWFGFRFNKKHYRLVR